MSVNEYMAVRHADNALRVGNLATAIASYRHALALNAQMPDVWYNLGYALRLNREFHESLDAYEQALAHRIALPEEVHLNRAAIFSEHLDGLDEAVVELRKALSIRPDFLAALLNLGMLHEDQGDVSTAREAYEAALKIAPQNGHSLSRLAAIAAFSHQAEDIRPRLETAITHPALSSHDKIDISFGLASIYDAVGRYDEAFSLAVSANRAQLDQLPAQFGYDPEKHERLINDLCEMPLPPPLDLSNADGAAPVFICGLFRSGSTLAEQLLARHSDIVAGGEYDFIPEMVANHLQPYPVALKNADQAKLGRLHEEYVARLAAIGNSNGLVSDKRCDNFLHIGLIKSLFPNAKIIHTFRSPLDNAVSLFFQHFADGINYAMDLEHLGHWMRMYRKLMSRWHALYGSDIHDFCYDDAVLDVEPTVLAMVEQCGRQWRPDAGSVGKIVKTASAWQVRQPLHRRSSGRWKNYARELRPLMKAAGIDENGHWLKAEY